MDNKKSKELAFLQEAGLQLVANKIFCGYMLASEIMPVEPEHFVEDYIVRCLNYPTKMMKSSIWRYFLENLIIYRKIHRR